VTEPRAEVAAGGVVLRRGPAGPEVVLAEQLDRNTRARTVRLPKGKPEPGESLDAAALREVREETGVEADLLGPLHEVRYRYRERRAARWVDKRVHFFLMRHREGALRAADGEFERVFWCALAEAEGRLSFDTERAVVAAARAALEAPGGPRL
jgi:bis(5'-nucleosidyl)-tetraphosphatase